MIEGLVAALLSRFLGDFVNGLERENLRIGILSGEVTLENLELKKEALQNFDLPITVKSGAYFHIFLLKKLKRILLVSFLIYYIYIN